MNGKQGCTQVIMFALTCNMRVLGKEVLFIFPHASFSQQGFSNTHQKCLHDLFQSQKSHAIES